jgi:hypothetical protein
VSVRKVLPLSGLLRRYVWINACLFTLANPTPLSLASLLQHPLVAPGLKVLLAALWLGTMAALLRQAVCGFRALGRVPVGFLLLTCGCLLQAVADPLLAAPVLLMSFVQVTAGLLLTVGNVAAYYVRQVSGQSPVLKTPP